MIWLLSALGLAASPLLEVHGWAQPDRVQDQCEATFDLDGGVKANYPLFGAARLA